MKKPLIFTLQIYIIANIAHAQSASTNASKIHEKEIYVLIDKYTQARDDKNSDLLNSILTEDIDQLVSSGTWRAGKEASMKGMMRSSNSNPGDRTITVDKLRFLTKECAIADAKYEIQNPDGSARKMWSTFIVVLDGDSWKITAIRNMLPAK